MEKSTIFNRQTIYFYGPSIPWQTVSQNQRLFYPHFSWVTKLGLPQALQTQFGALATSDSTLLVTKPAVAFFVW